MQCFDGWRAGLGKQIRDQHAGVGLVGIGVGVMYGDAGVLHGLEISGAQDGWRLDRNAVQID